MYFHICSGVSASFQGQDTLRLPPSNSEGEVALPNPWEIEIVLEIPKEERGGEKVADANRDRMHFPNIW